MLYVIDVVCQCECDNHRNVRSLFWNLMSALCLQKNSNNGSRKSTAGQWIPTMKLRLEPIIRKYCFMAPKNKKKWSKPEFFSKKFSYLLLIENSLRNSDFKRFQSLEKKRGYKCSKLCVLRLLQQIYPNILSASGAPFWCLYFCCFGVFCRFCRLGAGDFCNNDSW